MTIALYHLDPVILTSARVVRERESACGGDARGKRDFSAGATREGKGQKFPPNLKGIGKIR